MVDTKIRTIFKQGSKTYFNSSLFFPPRIREYVFVLYSFVRTADNYVDSVPQQPDEFYTYKEAYLKSLDSNAQADNLVIEEFIQLLKRKKFDPAWVDAFLDSMEKDLYTTRYQTLQETEEYIYGSAEVIGLMMAKIMDLVPESFPHARMLGKAMQYVNFIRDISEDIELGRIYFPMEHLHAHNLDNLDYEHVVSRKEKFRKFIREEIERYYSWQKEGEAGFKYIPKRYLIPIRTASEMYKWTAQQIARNPFVIYERKIKPSRPRIISRVLYNTIRA